MPHLLVVCTANRIDGLFSIAESRSIKEAVTNGYNAYKEANSQLQASSEDYRSSLHAYVHDPVGYSDWTYALISIPEKGKPEVLDLEELLEDEDFWYDLGKEGDRI